VGFLRYEFGGLIFGEASTWSGLFSEFYGILLWLSKRHLISSEEVTIYISTSPAPQSSAISIMTLSQRYDLAGKPTGRTP